MLQLKSYERKFFKRKIVSKLEKKFVLGKPMFLLKISKFQKLTINLLKIGKFERFGT